MQTLDLIIIFGYLIGITVFGILFSGKQETTADYFVGGRSVPWWAIAMSIVATETSTITFISVPGIAFARNGNFQFLQLVFGYMLGRVVISLIFIPLYFKGDLQTVYQLLGERFGNKVKMLASSLFVVMRNIADGIRLLLTAIVLAAVYTAFVPGTDATLVIVGSIILLGVVMIIFTFYGGMEAIIWIEVVQLLIYIGGAIAAAVVIANQIEGGFAGAIEIGRQFDKFDVFDFTWDFTKTYTFWAGLIGGCFLTMSTHGTDQYLVQRYLCTNKPSRSIICPALERSGRAWSVYRFPVYRRAAVCLLRSLQFGRVCSGRGCRFGYSGTIAVLRWRQSFPRFHYEIDAEWHFGLGRCSDFCCRAVEFAEFDRGDIRQRSLQTVQIRQGRQAFPKSLAHPDARLRRHTDRRRPGRHASGTLGSRSGFVCRIAYLTALFSVFS